MDMRSVVSTQNKRRKSRAVVSKVITTTVTQRCRPDPERPQAVYREQTFHCLTSRRFAQVLRRRHGKGAQHKGTLSKAQ